MYLVGSSIHGNLLDPQDTDIAVETDSREEFNTLSATLQATWIHAGKGSIVSVSRQGRLNFIILSGVTVKEYSKGMDVNLVRGYKDLSTGILFLHPEAKKGLKNKTIEILKRNARHEKMFTRYATRDENREVKYLKKLPKGFTFIKKNEG